MGQGIVDSQNALGQSIVDAQNYITLQHNVLGEWLHETLCAIYQQDGGSCEAQIGPFPEYQTFTPMVLQWPEGQLSLLEKIDQIQDVLSIGSSDILEGQEGTVGYTSSDKNAEVKNMIRNELKEVKNTVKVEVDHIEGKVNGKVDEGRIVMEDKFDKMEGKVDKIGGEVDKIGGEVDKIGGEVDKIGGEVDKIGGKVDRMEDKVDKMEDKVDEGRIAMEGKVDTVQNELKEMKNMITKLMNMMANE